MSADPAPRRPPHADLAPVPLEPWPPAEEGGRRIGRIGRLTYAAVTLTALFVVAGGAWLAWLLLAA